MYLTGQKINDDGFADLIKDIPRMLAREWTKLCYYLPRAIGFFILLWVLPVIGQILWVLFTCWMYAVQYKDYAFDNHKISFKEMKNDLKSKQGLSYGFGFAVMLLTAIPFVNLIFAIWMTNLMSKSFGKSEGFTIGLLLLPLIFYPILGFGSANYIGPAGK